MQPDENLEVGAALEEIQRVLDSPLAALVGTEEERGEAAELIRQAVARCWPVLGRTRRILIYSERRASFVHISLPSRCAHGARGRRTAWRVASTADLRSELGLSERTLTGDSAKLRR